MKKIKVLLIGLLIGIPISANAKSYTFEDMTYELNNNYKVTTKENINETTYIPLEYKKDELLELFNKKEFYLLGLNEDHSNLKFKIKNVSSCGNIANNKKEMNECLSNSISELKENESIDLVRDNTFTSKNGINYYTLEYFKFGSTLLDVTTSYNNKVYTFTLATSYSKDDIEKNAKEIMDSVTLNGFIASIENSKNEPEKNVDNVKDNPSILVIAITSFIIIVGGISIYIFKKK